MWMIKNIYQNLGGGAQLTGSALFNQCEVKISLGTKTKEWNEIKSIKSKDLIKCRKKINEKKTGNNWMNYKQS